MYGSCGCDFTGTCDCVVTPPKATCSSIPTCILPLLVSGRMLQTIGRWSSHGMLESDNTVTAAGSAVMRTRHGSLCKPKLTQPRPPPTCSSPTGAMILVGFGEEATRPNTPNPTHPPNCTHGGLNSGRFHRCFGHMALWVRSVVRLCLFFGSVDHTSCAAPI